MTGWWLPLKWFLFRTKDGNRDHRTAELIEIKPAKNDISILTEELSILRHGSSTVLSDNVVKELLAFLCMIYSEGNLTSVARTNKLGPLDGWNSKLEDLKKKYHDIDKWVKFVQDNCFESFFECSKGTFYDNLFVVAVSTGLRPGEVCALTLKDVDFKDSLIRVNKTLVYQTFEGEEKKSYHFDNPKTKSSKRDIPMNQQCALALKKQLMQRNVVMGRTVAKPITGFEELLFTTKFGIPINTQTYSDAIKAVLENVNLCRDELEKIEYFSPHCFRHTFATRCFEAGIKPKTVQQYLGHATLQMTMDLYTHVLKEHSQEEMIKLEKVLDNTLDVSVASIHERFDKFQELENDTNKAFNKETCKTQSKSKKNIVYLSSVGT